MGDRKTKYVKIRKQNAHQFIVSIPAWLVRDLKLKEDEICEVLVDKDENIISFRIVERK